jgi:uncharacterized protein (DUF2147 family)
MKTMLKILAITSMMIFTNAAMAYGAIAVNDEEGLKAAEVGFGYGTGDSESAAKADAVKECKKAGNDACKAEVAYKLCGAYASSKSVSGVGKGDTEEEAKKNALKECGDGCRVVASDCDN